MKKHIIFDFDGTLWDSFHVSLSWYNKFSKFFWLKNITTLEEIDFLRKSEPNEILKYIWLSTWKIPFFLILVKLYINFHRNDVSLFPWISDLLHKLKDDWYMLYILSSNSTSFIKNRLKNIWEKSCISRIVGSSSLLSKDKNILSLLQKEWIDISEAIYIWDEVRDIVACNKINIDSVAVSRWYSHKEALVTHTNSIIDTVDDLFEYIQKH